MSSIAAELSAPSHVRPCIVGAFVDTLDPEDSAAVKGTLGRPRTAAKIWRVLSRRGMSASTSQVRIHARRDCNCTKAGHQYDAPKEDTAA
ncbi:hypothetical protein [Rhodococcus opacus]|uniref:hypothetical protein n=1 Tax=Rhodococcus opacus TaxID=37919 RepID=UPI001C466A3D|nr:hypothetical protein [Rhodococcus opacus]MBV6758385.1 hypothetical protein [Rhodococcus opacus]